MTPSEDNFRAHAAALHSLVSLSPDHFYLYARNGKHLYASPAAAQALDIKQEDFIDKTWQEMGFPADVTERFDIEREEVFKHGHPWHGELIFPTEMGQPSSLHDYVLSPVCAEDGSVEAVLVTARDITKRKQEEEALQYAALHDTLTGLANRTLLNDRLEQNLLAAHRSKSSIALLFLDLDHFKAANDSVGHHGGDLLLQQLAVRWSGSLREADTLSRLGGDEFVVLSPAANERGATEIASRLQAKAEEAFDIEGQCIRITASVGIAVDTGGLADANELMKQADEAMYRAKRQRAHGSIDRGSPASFKGM